jgi:transglutaminase-like putative cysteine protease
MPILTVRHVTTYHYKQPVAFGEHRMMLRPRDDDDQKVLESELRITPEPSQLAWTKDIFGNHVATACFADRASKLRFDSSMHLDHAPGGFHAADIDDFARTYPFAYAAEDKSDLARFIAPLSPHRKRWAAKFLRQDGSADTRELLVDLMRTINQNFKHVARHEKGTQDPIKTLKLGSGRAIPSERSAPIMSTARSRQARFVSGYLNLDDDDDDRVTGGNTHAWVQVYVPGPGWGDFDPSSGMVGNRNLVRVAVVREPREAIPLQGTWIGTASDHLAMNVAVTVITATDAGARLGQVDMAQDAGLQ